MSFLWIHIGCLYCTPRYTVCFTNIHSVDNKSLYTSHGLAAPKPTPEISGRPVWTECAVAWSAAPKGMSPKGSAIPQGTWTHHRVPIRNALRTGPPLQLAPHSRTGPPSQSAPHSETGPRLHPAPRSQTGPLPQSTTRHPPISTASPAESARARFTCGALPNSSPNRPPSEKSSQSGLWLHCTQQGRQTIRVPFPAKSRPNRSHALAQAEPSPNPNQTPAEPSQPARLYTDHARP